MLDSYLYLRYVVHVCSNSSCTIMRGLNRPYDESHLPLVNCSIVNRVDQNGFLVGQYWRESNFLSFREGTVKFEYIFVVCLAGECCASKSRDASKAGYLHSSRYHTQHLTREVYLSRTSIKPGVMRLFNINSNISIKSFIACMPSPSTAAPIVRWYLPIMDKW